MGFYTQQDVENGTFKKPTAKAIAKKVGAGLTETFEDISLEAPKITKRKQLKKLNELEEPSSTKNKLRTFIDFKFK